MAPKLRRRGSLSALKATYGSRSDLGDLIFTVAIIDFLQILFGLFAAIPFVGLPIAFVFPWVFSILGFVMIGLKFGEKDVKFLSGSKMSARLWALGIMVFIEALPVVNLGFGFTFGVINIIRTLREEQEGSVAQSSDTRSVQARTRQGMHMPGFGTMGGGSVRNRPQAESEQDNRSVQNNRNRGQRAPDKKRSRSNPDIATLEGAGIRRKQRPRVDGLTHTQPEEEQDTYREAV